MRSASGTSRSSMKTWFEIDGGPAHLLDLPRLDAGAVELGIEEAHAVGRLGAIGERRGARQQQDAGRDLGQRGPDLPARDHIAGTPAPGHGRDPGGVEAGIGLRHAEGADVAAVDQGRQEAPALRLAAVFHDDPGREDGDMHRRGAGHAGPGFRDRLHRQRRLGDAEPRPAIFLRHGGADPAAGSEGGDELARKFPVPVARQPIAVVEPLAKPQHIVPDHLLLVAQHGLPYFKAATYEHLSRRSPQHPFLPPPPAGRALACVDLKPRSILPSFPRKRESRASDGCLACGPGFPLSRE